jgi:hypothetical protein
MCSVGDSLQFQGPEDHLNLIADRLVDVVQVQLRVLWWLVGGRDAGEVRYLTPACLLVQSLRVAALCDVERGVDKNLNELTVLEQHPGHLTLGPERRDEAAQHNHARVNHEFCDLADPADVLDPVRVGEPEVGVQAMTQVVPVQDIGPDPALAESLLERVGDRRLPGAREAREPEALAGVPVQAPA